MTQLKGPKHARCLGFFLSNDDVSQISLPCALIQRSGKSPWVAEV